MDRVKPARPPPMIPRSRLRSHWAVSLDIILIVKVVCTGGKYWEAKQMRKEYERGPNEIHIV